MKRTVVFLIALFMLTTLVLSCSRPAIQPATPSVEPPKVSTENSTPTQIQQVQIDPEIIGRWQFIGPITEGQVVSVRDLVSTEENGKAVIYAGTEEPGRILKWSEETQSWNDVGYKVIGLVEEKLIKEAEQFRKANPPLPIPGYRYPIGWIGALAVDPTSPKTIYVGLGPQMLLAKTIDGGENWSLIDYRHSEPRSLAISNENPQVVYLGTNDGLLKSTDGGETWTLLDNGIPTYNFLVWTVAIDPKDNSFVIAGGEPANKKVKFGSEWLYYSQDSGESWKVVQDTTKGGEERSWQSFPVVDIEFAPDTGIMYLTTEGGPLYLTRDRKTWESWPRADEEERVSFYEVEVNPINPQMLYASGPKGVYRSQDQGKTWSGINEGLGAKRTGNLAISKDGRFLYVVCYRSVGQTGCQYQSIGVWRLKLK